MHKANGTLRILKDKVGRSQRLANLGTLRLVAHVYYGVACRILITYKPDAGIQCDARRGIDNHESPICIPVVPDIVTDAYVVGGA